MRKKLCVRWKRNGRMRVGEKNLENDSIFSPEPVCLLCFIHSSFQASFCCVSTRSRWTMEARNRQMGCKWTTTQAKMRGRLMEQKNSSSNCFVASIIKIEFNFFMGEKKTTRSKHWKCLTRQKIHLRWTYSGRNYARKVLKFSFNLPPFVALYLRHFICVCILYFHRQNCEATKKTLVN